MVDGWGLSAVRLGLWGTWLERRTVAEVGMELGMWGTGRHLYLDVPRRETQQLISLPGLCTV